jgi:glycosyltransferase involved in cell wall biosynthesis
MSETIDNWGEALRARSVVVHNGVDASEVRSSAGLDWTPKGEFSLLFPGGTKWLKGGDLVIEALAEVRQEVPGIHLYVALKVPSGHALRKAVSALGLEDNVTFVGHLSTQEYRSLLRPVDLLIMPSRQEAFGVVFLEAMALGKPIAATRTGGIPEVVEDGRNGILVEPEAGEIAQAILRLYRDEDLRRRLSQNNLRDVARYDWSVIADKYVEVYSQPSGAM